LSDVIRILVGLLLSATTVLSAGIGVLYAYLMFSATSFAVVALGAVGFLFFAFCTTIIAWAAGSDTF